MAEREVFQLLAQEEDHTGPYHKKMTKMAEQVQKDIETKGFSNAALIHGVSDSSNNGGKLGWIKLSSLNSKIKDQITKIGLGKFLEKRHVLINLSETLS